MQKPSARKPALAYGFATVFISTVIMSLHCAEMNSRITFHCSNKIGKLEGPRRLKHVLHLRTNQSYAKNFRKLERELLLVLERRAAISTRLPLRSTPASSVSTNVRAEKK